MERSCLIVGAGMAGLAAGRRLQAAGWRVLLVDKGRVAGGRVATRTFDEGRFDYGAQFFTMRDAGFAELAQPWIDMGLAIPWAGHRFRAAGGMRAVAEKMAAGLDVRSGSRVTRLASNRDGWAATLETGETLQGRCLLLTPPVPQSLALLDQSEVRLDDRTRTLLEGASYWKCLTVMLHAEGTAPVGECGFAEPGNSVLAWVGDNFAKGVSPLPGCLTLHATREFSEAHWDQPQATAVHAMLEAAEPYLRGRVLAYYLHRWRYAEPAMQMPALFHAEGNLVFAGDVFGGGRVGGAVVSGLAAADFLVNNAR